MTISNEIIDNDDLKEDFDLEANLCHGRDGQVREMLYLFPVHHPISGGDIFEANAGQAPSISSEHKDESSEHIDSMKKRVSVFLSTKRANPAALMQAILETCKGCWISTAPLARMLKLSGLNNCAHNDELKLMA